MNRLFRPLPGAAAVAHDLRKLGTGLCVLILLAGTSGETPAFAHRRQVHHRQIHHEKRADVARRAQHRHRHHNHKSVSKKSRHGHVAAKRHAKAASHEHKPSHNHNVAHHSAAALALIGDAAAVKNVFDLARQGKTSDATAAEKTIADPAARKLAEWLILRAPGSGAKFSRYVAFIADNPGWPGMTLLRRRAEARLWQERSDASTVHAFTGDHPLTALGRLALARVLLAEGRRDRAQRLVRKVWRSAELTEHTETDALAVFRDLLTPEDFRARMDKRIGAGDIPAAMRAAHHLGDDAVSIVKACAAVERKSDKTSDRLGAVATHARGDLGYVLCRVRYLMHHDKLADASRLTLAAPLQAMALQDTDEWWRVRRALARRLLDQGDAGTAYRIASTAAPPERVNYRVQSHFLPGWIALRYLNDPKMAAAQFAHVDDGCINPITRARANYWRGRTAEALGDTAAMGAAYEAAARYPTAYYGQLARAKLGIEGIVLRTPPLPDPANPLTAELERAVDMLYAIGERNTVVAFVADLAEESTDVPMLTALAELTGRHNDARAMLELGRRALARGLALDSYAFPTIGIPHHAAIGPPIDRSILYAVARTESAFNQRDKSKADAVGLMQVTPGAARDTAKRFGVRYDWDRMISDPVYNTQMGAAELGALLKQYRGSKIMTFAGYNAGRGRGRDWVKQHGDPRDPDVDPVDWVERIPFAETRNYVQRVMEDWQVYRSLFGHAQPVIANSGGQRAAEQEAASIPAP
ncbi:MAG: lytic transglycosylase domain-containing protein [Bradyrhizobium sp.]